LRRELLAIARLPEAAQPVLRVRVDGSQRYQRYWDIVSLVRKCGLRQISLDTEVGE